MNTILKIVFIANIVFLSCSNLKEKDSVTNLVLSRVPYKKQDYSWSLISSNINESNAKKLLTSKEKALKLFFEKKYDPYTGEIIGLEECQNKNLPKSERIDDKKKILNIHHVYASVDRVIGKCTDSEKLLKVQYHLLYCKKEKALFAIRYFYSPQREWLKGDRLSCP